MSAGSEWLDFFGTGDVDWGDDAPEPELSDDDGFYPDELGEGELEAEAEYDTEATEWDWEYDEPWDEFDSPEDLDEWIPEWDEGLYEEDGHEDQDWYAGLDDEWDY